MSVSSSVGVNDDSNRTNIVNFFFHIFSSNSVTGVTGVTGVMLVVLNGASVLVFHICVTA
jgi:hypothetical protein